MKRSGPLRRNKSLRQSYADKIKADAAAGAARMVERKFGKRTPLKKIAKSTRKRMTAYLALSRVWLETHPWCEICKARNAHCPDVTEIRRATEVHHKRGRVGKLLLNTDFFVASCRDCREWPHTHPAAARAIGVLAGAAEWNTSPE
jgi:hypothetical protein